MSPPFPLRVPLPLPPGPASDRCPDLWAVRGPVVEDPYTGIYLFVFPSNGPQRLSYFSSTVAC